jgi:hypothetical protein
MIIVVKKCKNCPFLTFRDEKQRCSASNPTGRPVAPDEVDRPSFCPLRREQVIVREFA